MVSCIKPRLELSPISVCSGSSPNSGASSARSSGSPWSTTVIAGVAAVGREVVARAGKREQRAGQIELLGRGFATGEIQLHSPGGEIVVAPACGVVDGAHLLWRGLGQVGHGVGGGHAPPE